jgi:transposase
MTFVRRIKRNDSVYVYNVTTYRDKTTGKVKQDTEYLGKEVEKDGEKVIIPPKRKRGGLREILDYGLQVELYNVANEFGLPSIIQDKLELQTNIKDIGEKLTILAINKITSDMTIRSVPNWYARSAIKVRSELSTDDITTKRVRGLLDLLAETSPDVTGMIEEAIAKRIKELYPEDLKTAVYDLTAITYHGDSNDLAQYGHAYRTSGEKQINMVLGVTLDNKLPLHHKVLPGKIVSVSTIHSFVKELSVFGVTNAILILDRGFYSKRNIEEIQGKGHQVIGALSSNLKITKDALTKSVNIQNSRNLLKYPDSVTFYKEFKGDGLRVLVYHDGDRKNRQVRSFYEGLAEVETRLDEISGKTFETKMDLNAEIYGVCGKRYRKHISIKYDCNDDPNDTTTKVWTFTYKLKHKSIQRSTNRMGNTVLFTTTSLSPAEVLKAYRERDVIEKTFQLMKKHGLTPINASTEGATRSRVMVSYLGYLLLSLMRMKLDEDTSLGRAMSTLSEVREVVYSDGTRELPELTKPQKKVMGMVGLL